MNHELPENFDWVTARANCSLPEVFEKLKQQINNDVTTRNSLRPAGAHYVFRFVEGASNSFSVVVEGAQIHDTVRFTLNADRILIHTKDGLLYEPTVTLCDDGECRAKMANQVFDLWQLRKKVLEDLFFRTY
jgi:hypothetical protein